MLKSAYELALEKTGGLKENALSPSQKKLLAEIDAKFAAKIAESEILFNQKMQGARQSFEQEELDRLHEMFAREKNELLEKRDREKERVRGQSS